MHESATLRDGTPEAVGLDPKRLDLIRERARGWVANGDTPSLALLVARKGVMVLHEAFGILRPTDNAPLQRDSIFPVFSISKPITAAAILCLAEDGLLWLKHPMTDYLPEITTPGADQVLIADLLTHTSGYDDLMVHAHSVQRRDAQPTIPEPAPGQHAITNCMIRYGCDAPLVRAPGDVMRYCNLGYLLLSDIVRRVGGQSFAAFAQSRIFAPLGMHDSRFVFPQKLRARRVLRQVGFPGTQPHLIGPFMPAVDSEDFDSWDWGAGGLASTATDIATFAQMLLNGGVYGEHRVLSRASVNAMTTPQLPPGTPASFSMLNSDTGQTIEMPVRGGSYGYGLFMTTVDDRTRYINGSLAAPRTFGHMGALQSAFWADPNADVVGVYLSVMPRFRGEGELLWHFDRFQDMVHASIVD
jgi:CubicO group peptidase (beta-lactamase class C family)